MPFALELSPKALRKVEKYFRNGVLLLQTKAVVNV